MKELEFYRNKALARAKSKDVVFWCIIEKLNKQVIRNHTKVINISRKNEIEIPSYNIKIASIVDKTLDWYCSTITVRKR